MKTPKIVKLPFWETIGRSFKYVLKNKALLIAIMPVIGALTVFQIILGQSFLCSVDASRCDNSWQQLLTLLAMLISAVAIIINYCRSIICKADVDFTSLKFWKQTGLYLAASLAFSIILLAPSFVCIFVAVLFFNFLGLPIVSAAVSIIIPIAFCIFFAPLFLVFPAIAVEDYKLINWSKLFSLTKENHNAIFWGQFIIMTPYWLLSLMLIEIYQLMGVNNYAINLIFIIFSITISLIDACFKGAFFAHIYQFFKYYEKK